MRNKIIGKIKQIREKEENFKSSWWKDVYVSYTYNKNLVTQHISEVDFESLNDDDLFRLFIFVLLTDSDITSNRVKQTYFNR